MGLRFRRRIKVLPGVYLNVSRSGVSTSVGVRGAHVTLGHGKVRATSGIPGSGLSYTQSESIGGHGAETPERPQAGRWLRLLLWAVFWFMAGSVALFWVLSKL